MRFVEFRRRCQLALHRLMHGDSYLIHGVNVAIPASVGTELRYQLMRGRYENDEADAVRRYLPVGAAVIELGGSLGVMSKVIRSAIGNNGRHLIVEANPALINICKSNAADPRFDHQSEVINAAVAYGVDAINFQFGHNAHVGRIKNGANTDGVLVKTASLASLAEQLGENIPFCLVCDIEGAEYDVFENEFALFERLQFAVLEIHPEIFEESGRSRDSFMGLLNSRNIRVIEDHGQILVLAGPAAA